ncbi:MAG TPA: tRNA (adenosine(37)-N6)-threonylcarbamoyltransferase complex dimerization subunit type 1 TsaB [Tenericutes bacterium]|nr:tRNA (adenosine(37)-N6)-threonylcarbamoyltransferase complex dimerization subunit type 1 TsaB [Mycoplasmatota bacterium]
MISLFIDTASSNLIIYLIQDGKIVSYTNKKVNNEMSIYFFPELEKLFNNSGLKPIDVDNIFIVNGPGSFTGIRIGLTVSKIYGSLMDKKVIPISSLELLATTDISCDYICSLIDARRGFVYAGLYDKNLETIIPDQHISVEELLKVIPKNKVVKFISYDEINNIDITIPNVNILKIVNKHITDEGINPHSLKPNYLKKTEAEENIGLNL